MNLFQASHQWATRPNDERFSNLKEMFDACKGYHATAHEFELSPDHLNVVTHLSSKNPSEPNDLRFAIEESGKSRRTASFTHWSFGQFCRSVGAPAEYLRGLPAELAVKNLRHGIEQLQNDSSRRPLKILTHTNGTDVLRAMTSVSYSRIWNWEVIERIIELPDKGWIVPPARPALPDQSGTRLATKEDIVPGQADFGLSVKVGDPIAPAGLYASDHDLFVFLLLPAARVNDGTDLGMMKGMFISNSEVGAQSLKITKFRMRACCGNHICWDASGILEVRIVHRGKADSRFVNQLSMELLRYGEEGVEEEEKLIQAAQRYTLGKDKNEVLDVLFGIKNLGPTRKQLDEAYDLAEENEDYDGNPRSIWGMVQGLTRLSQRIPYMDQRARIDRSAGKIMELAL